MKNIFRILMRPGISLVVAFSFFIIVACGEKKNNETINKNPSQEIKIVKVSSVKAIPLRGSVEYVGTLVAHLKVNLATEMGGTMEGLFFERGDGVRKGQILAEISTSSISLEVKRAEAAVAVARSQLIKTEKGSRPEEIRITEAALEQAEANLEEVEKNFKRIKDLHQNHAVSNKEYDSAKMAMETAQAATDSARQQLELAKQGPRIEDREAARASFHQAQSALAIAMDRLRKSRLKSPCDCIVAFRHVEKGEVVGPGTVITQLVDKSRMKIKLSLAEKDLLLVEKDKELSFAIDALPGEEFTCRLTFLSPTADPVIRSFPLELSVDKPDPRMADGMTVRVKFPITDPKMSIKVPSAWLTEENGHMGLFVVKEGKAVFKKVVLGSYYEQKVEILSGISDNTLVIMNPAGLKSGDVVKY